MNKKRTTRLTAISIIVLAIVLGICFLRFWHQDRPDKRDETQSVITTELSVELTTESVAEPTVDIDSQEIFPYG